MNSLFPLEIGYLLITSIQHKKEIGMSTNQVKYIKLKEGI